VSSGIGDGGPVGYVVLAAVVVDVTGALTGLVVVVLVADEAELGLVDEAELDLVDAVAVAVVGLVVVGLDVEDVEEVRLVDDEVEMEREDWSGESVAARAMLRAKRMTTAWGNIVDLGGENECQLEHV
jgi:hypothetical protein